MSTFRLATVNIHQFRGARTFDNNIDELVNILRPLELDLIAVEEIIDGDYWKTFCEKLALDNFIVGPCHHGFLSNGIASRHPILCHSNQSSQLTGVTEARALLQCQLGGDHPFVRDRLFAVTHLDHINEDTRIAQIKQFQPYEHNIDVLMGDMNALTKDDYSDSYYQEIVAGKRERSVWEKPRFNLTQLITDEWKYQDAFRLANPQAKDEEVVTCAYGTRIDYIYLRPRNNDPWKLTKCSIINTQPATNHNAVFAEFEQCPTSED